MLCAFFLNLHKRLPTRPKTFGTPLALVIGSALLLTGTSVRLLGKVLPGLEPWGWWPASLLHLCLGDDIATPLAPPPQQLVLCGLGVSVAESAIGFLLTRFGNIAYWALDRWVLEPVLLRPTEWVLHKMTGGYAWLLGWSVRHWGIVLGQGLALIAVAFV